MSEKVDQVGQMRHGPGGGMYRIVATAAQTGNAHFAIETFEPPGGGTPLHVHQREDELFSVLEGEFTFWLGGKVSKVSAGMTAFGPRGVPHCFKNCSNKPAKMLVVATPGHIERFFDYGLPLPGGGVPSDQMLIENIMKMAPAFGLELLGPSPL